MNAYCEKYYDHKDHCNNCPLKDKDNCDEYIEGYNKGRADILMPYDVESIEELITNVKEKARAEMTIEECKKRKKELKRMLESIETLKLALFRSIAIEDMNIAELKKKDKEQKNE